METDRPKREGKAGTEERARSTSPGTKTAQIITRIAGGAAGLCTMLQSAREKQTLHSLLLRAVKY